jgi:hypothetical protein
MSSACSRETDAWSMRSSLSALRPTRTRSPGARS